MPATQTAPLTAADILAVVSTGQPYAFASGSVITECGVRGGGLRVALYGGSICWGPDPGLDLPICRLPVAATRGWMEIPEYRRRGDAWDAVHDALRAVAAEPVNPTTPAVMRGA